MGTALLDAVGPVHRLWVLEANHGGRAFYERRGWRWSGTRQAAEDADGEPELLYVAPLVQDVQASPSQEVGELLVAPVLGWPHVGADPSSRSLR